MTGLTRRVRDAADAGFSLAEVLVSMAVMSIVMAIASSGFYDMFHVSDTAETTAAAQTELQAAFNKLDREVRYASRVSDPYANASTYSIDFVYADDAGIYKCVQLSLPRTGGTLLRKEWLQQDGAPSAAATAVANNLVSARFDTGTPPQKINPFSLDASGDGGSALDRLNLKVNSVVGQDVTKQGVREYDLQFTAQNTLPRAKYPLVCTH